MQTLKRGADGWRGIICEQFSSASAIRLSLAVASFLQNKMGNLPVLITHDGRLQSQEVATDVVHSLAQAGFDVAFGGMQSTPATSSFLTERRFCGAIIITASHNPFYWNGLKVKVSPGLPLSLEDERAIEKILENPPSASPKKEGTISWIPREEIFTSYAEKSQSVLTQEEISAIQARKFKVAIDALHGMSGDAYRVLLKNLGCELTILGEDPHPLFYGILPDPMNPISRRRLATHMAQEPYDIGFVSDGDGDRLGVFDEQGRFIWPHDILALLAEDILNKAPQEFGIAVSGPTGSIIDRICAKLNRKCVKTAVGFKYASAYLQSKEVILAGGAVGEIGFASDNMDRDPLKSIVLLLHFCAQTGKKLSTIIQELHSRYGSGVYKQWTLQGLNQDTDLKELGTRLIEKLGYSVENVEHIEGYRLTFDTSAWILLRRATTEGGARIYAELHTDQQLEKLFQWIHELTGILPQEKA